MRLQTSVGRAFACPDAGLDIKLMPEVVEAYFLTGDSDYLLRVRVKDTDHYRGFLRDHLLKIPKVESAQ